MSVPLAYVVNPFFDELTLNIRERPMSWEGYQKASLITEGELDLLKTFETNYTPNKSDSQESEPVSESYLLLLLDLLNKLVRVDTLQYILVLIDDILDANPENIKIIQNLKNSRQGYPIEPFLKCLHKDDDFLALKAEKILTALISTSDEGYTPALQPFLDSLVAQLSSKTPNVADITVQILQSLLNNVSYRFQFYNHSQGISNLINLLKSDQLNPQIQYQILFCIWILTFQTKIAQEIQFKFNILPILSNIAKSTVKEKIVRVIVGTFKNLLERAPEVNIQYLLNFKIHQLSGTLSQRKWTDEEIVEDVEYLKENLEAACRDLTTWDEYRAELESGILEWSPPHNSPHFWKENATKLEDENNELLNILINILNTSNDPLYLSVAAHDIGQYVQYSPKGKSLIEELGGKRRIMELMTHENQDVKYHSLVALQNCLMHSWDKQ